MCKSHPKIFWGVGNSDIKVKAFNAMLFFVLVSMAQFQSSLQVRFEKERRELEQAQSKLVKQLETRLDQVETANKVCHKG